MKFTFPPESKPLAGYTIKRAIHRGGFGEVYYALSDGGKEVALKLLQHNLEVELRGVKQCLNLKHPNLVTIFDVRSDDDGDQWIVMEYVSGKSLAEEIDEAGGPFSAEQTQKWLSGMADGLGYLHDCGIVHRDLKPANVFQEAGVVKIGDIGLSKFITQSRRSAQTESVGTVYYMAPEVAHGRYGREVDIYSLGIVLYELLTGRVPFDGESTAEILMKHLTEKPDLSPLPPKLRPVLARALEKDPLKRTPSVAQLEQEFNAALVGAEIPTDIPNESFVRSPGSRRPIHEVVAKYKSKAKQLHAEAHKAAVAAKQAARWQHKAERKRQKAQRHANRVASLASARASRHRANGTAPTRHAGRRDDSQMANWIKVAAVVFVLLTLFAPSAAVHSLRLLFVGGIFAALGYGAIRLCRSIAVPHPRSGETIAPIGDSHRETGYCNVAVPRHVRRLTPETLRSIPFRYRLADLTGAMTYAALVTALVTGGIAAVMPSLFSHGDAGSIGLFAITTLLGAWAVLVPSKLWEGTSVQPQARRFVLLGTGLLVGAAGFWLHQNLLVDANYQFGGNSPATFALFDSAGSRGLVGGDFQPTLAGYMIFFGVLFAVRRWWRHSDAFRKKRFRVGSLLLTGLAGFVVPLVFAFPQMWGLMWAVAISSVVQLSSAWVTPADRRRLMEGSIDA